MPAKRKAREKDASEDEDEGGSGEATPMAGMLLFFWTADTSFSPSLDATNDKTHPLALQSANLRRRSDAGLDVSGGESEFANTTVRDRSRECAAQWHAAHRVQADDPGVAVQAEVGADDAEGDRGGEASA